jgi:TonB family protein
MKYGTLLFALLLVSTGGASAQSQSQAQARAQALEALRLFEPGTRIATFEDWEKLLDETNKIEWQMNDVSSKIVDFNGDKLELPWLQTALPAQTKQKLADLHEKAKQASAAGDARALQAVLKEAQQPLDEQRRRTLLSSGGTMTMFGLVYHEFALKPWLQFGTDADREAANEQVRVLQKAVAHAVEEGLKSAAWDEKFEELMLPPRNRAWLAFNALRKRLVKEHPEEKNVVVVPARVRDKPCTAAPRAAGDPEPGDVVRISTRFPSAEDYYPPFSKSLNIDGPVVVRVLVSESGCAQRVEVVNTSGIRELDEGALALALNGVYVPRVREGQALPGELVFRINFELRD